MSARPAAGPVGADMGMALGTALVMIAIAVLVYPFLNRKKYALASDPALERLRVSRLRVYRQISDLEEDLTNGELTETDYGAQLRELRVAAARILREEERLGGAPGGDLLLEREIEAARRMRQGPPEGGDTLE